MVSISRDCIMHVHSVVIFHCNYSFMMWNAVVFRKNYLYSTDPDQILLCTELCCKFDLHEKCIELCSLKNQPSSIKLCLLKGKSLFYLYRREQDLLDRYSINLNDEEINFKRSSCYKTAEECIKMLGAALDQESIDSEGSKMLDLAMLDYIRETNKLNNLKRCLLCRKKKTLMKSHLWPRSFLRRYSSSRGQDISSRIFISFHSLKPREKSPGEVTYWMLCGECEQRISQNGEDKFASEIYDKVISEHKDNITLPYGPWLYNFSIGLVFRVFLYFIHGSTEHYYIFHQCRQHLLKLSVKYKDLSTSKHNENVVSSKSVDSTQHKEINSEAFPLVYLANPTKLNVEHPRKSMLVGALFDAGSAFFSGRYLTSGKLDLSGQKHFIVVRLGNLNILLTLKASTDYCPPVGSLIKPQGGELLVPCEDNRWSLIPEGLWAAIDSTATVIEETSLHHYAYKSKSGHWKSLSVEEQEPPIASKELGDKERLLHRSLKEASSSPESSFVSRFLKTASPSLSFLPNEIKLFQKHSYTKKGFLELPNSHVILLHGNVNLTEDAFTLFLVANFQENLSTLILYVIFVERIRGVQMAYGAYVCVDTNNKICITDSLVDMKKFSEHHAKRFEYYCHLVEEIFPFLLRTKGYRNIKELTHRAEITR